MSIESIFIPVSSIYGCYDYEDSSELLCVNADSTFIYKYYLNGEEIEESGCWEYVGSEKKMFCDILKWKWSQNWLVLHTGDSIEIKPGSRVMLVEKVHRFYVCYKHIYFGDVILTHGYEGDPDGAPKLKWLERVE